MASFSYLSVEDIKEICYSIVEELLQFEEPLPEFETRFPEKLESIVEIPRQEFGENELYPTVGEKAACYFYFIIKNHPFLNGNKRMAIITTYVFLRMNNHKLDVPWRQMYQFAIDMASASKNHEEEFGETVNFINKHLIEYKD